MIVLCNYEILSMGYFRAAEPFEKRLQRYFEFLLPNNLTLPLSSFFNFHYFQSNNYNFYSLFLGFQSYFLKVHSCDEVQIIAKPFLHYFYSDYL